MYESNGITKEYNGFEDTLIYEGKYLKNQRHWKGKLYTSTGHLWLEAEYLFGKRIEIGREYRNNDKLIFEGEYLNDKKHRRGKVYDYNGKLRFEGEYLYDKEWIGTGYDELDNILYKLENERYGKRKGKE